MDQDTRLVDHSQVEGSPVLKKGQINELVINGKVVVCRAVVWRCRRTKVVGLRTYARGLRVFACISVKDVWKRGRTGESGEV